MTEDDLMVPIVLQPFYRWVMRITLLGFVIFTAQPLSADDSHLFVAASVARMRATESPSSKVIQVLRIGTELEVLTSAHSNLRNGMLHVRTTRHSGYVSKRLLQKKAPTLEKLHQRYEQASSIRQKKKWIERATAFAPSDTDVIQKLMKTLKASGNHKGALMAEKGLIAAERRQLSWDGPLYPISNGIALFPKPCAQDSPQKETAGGFKSHPKNKYTDAASRLTPSKNALRARAFPWVNSGKVVSLSEKGYKTQVLAEPMCAEGSCGYSQLAYRMSRGVKNGALVPSWLVAGHRVEALLPNLDNTIDNCPTCRRFRNTDADFEIQVVGDGAFQMSRRDLDGWRTTKGETLPFKDAQPVALFSEREYQWFVLWESQRGRDCCKGEKQVWLMTILWPKEKESGAVKMGRIYSGGFSNSCPQLRFETLPGEPRCDRLPAGCELEDP